MHVDDLRDALAGAMIETHYQPIVAMADGMPVALEALARLKHPKLGILSPGHFVPQMEDAGLAAALTELVSHQAFTDMNSAHLLGHGLRVAINFPLDVILATEALTRLEEQRLAAGIAADAIIIELTESRPVEDLVTLRHSLEWLRARGYGIAIDDVGPAVPMLSSLLELPFTCLKLDMALVLRVETDPAIACFLRNTVRQAAAHGLTVVGEGVETPALWHRMKNKGVAAAQGFLIGRPMRVEQIPAWLESWKASPAIV